MNIGLFGGSFNPPHKGHLRAAEIFCREAALDKLIIVPAHVSPFKTEKTMSVSDSDRYEMTKLCFSELDDSKTQVEVSKIELERSGTSYTIDTVNELLSQYKTEKIYMLMGSDMFFSLERWKNFDELFKKCRIFTLPRQGGERCKMEETANQYSKKYGAEVHISKEDEFCVSSTLLRTYFIGSEHYNLQNLLTEKVLGYIIENNLYLQGQK